jgi:uncharacterized membrane protein YhaH (DUF805 family)
MEYWFFALTCWIASTGLGTLARLAGGEGSFPAALGGLFGLLTVLPQISVGVRRMHDVGKPGWYLLIPLVNVYYLLTSGDEGPNDYGPDPKAIEDAERDLIG